MTKQELLDSITKKEQQLSQAKREMNSWNSGKYKNSSNASVSKVYVNALEDELSALRKQLSQFSVN